MSDLSAAGILKDIITRWLNYMKLEWPSAPISKYEVSVQVFEKAKEFCEEEVCPHCGRSDVPICERCGRRVPHGRDPGTWIPCSCPSVPDGPHAMT